jgi:hypothetical protein
MSSVPSTAEQTALVAAQAENTRLIALLESHGIAWQRPHSSAIVGCESVPSRLSTAEKVALFRRLFRGLTDVYPVRWEGKTSGKSGYAPVCANEWRSGMCEKPRIKCGDCSNRLLIPLSDTVIYDHLTGKHTVGVYPLLEDDTCYFLAADFDEALQQYAGRLHREHASKANVRIMDFVDTGHPALQRMWDKRQRGYRAMGYRMEATAL